MSSSENGLTTVHRTYLINKPSKVPMLDVNVVLVIPFQALPFLLFQWLADAGS